MTEFTFSSDSNDNDFSFETGSTSTQVFRRLYAGRDSMIGVEATVQNKWVPLKEKVGDDWIAYQWLGTREHVERLLEDGYESIEDIPVQEISLDAKGLSR